MCGKLSSSRRLDGDLADVGEPGGHGQVVERRVFGMKCERNEGLEAAGLVLQGAELEQVIDAVGVVFNVAVEHGRIRFEAQLVRRARGFEPLFAVNLVVADDGADARGEDLRAAAGHGVHTRLAQLEEGFFDAELGAASQKRDLHHGEGLDVHLGETFFEPLDQIQEELKRQIGVQAADDVELGDGFRVAGGRGLPRLIEGHGVARGIALFAAEGAELAGRDAHVGGVDVAIDVEVGHVAVHPLAHMVGQPTHGQHVTVSRRATRPSSALSRSLGHHLGGDGLQAGVVGLKCVAWEGGQSPRSQRSYH